MVKGQKSLESETKVDPEGQNVKVSKNMISGLIRLAYR